MSENHIRRINAYLKQDVVLIILLFIILLGSFWVNQSIEEVDTEIKHSEIEKIESLQLVNELRQSSDDLTNMARLYVTTGKKEHKDYFNRIISIRDGNENRPIDYQDVYWDFVLATKKDPRPGDEKKSLLSLIESVSSSSAAKSHFVQAKESSDDLIKIEEEAFNAMEGKFKDSLGKYTIVGPPDQQLAIELLHGEKYFAAKAKIMSSIQDFSHYMDEFVSGKIKELENRQSSYQLVQSVLLIIIISILLFVLINITLRLIRYRNKNKLERKTDFKFILQEIRGAWVLQLTSLSFSILIALYLIYTNDSIRKDNEVVMKSTLTTVRESAHENVLDWLEGIERDVNQFVSRKDIIASIQNGDNSRIEEQVRFNFQDSYKGYIIVDDNGSISHSNFADWERKSIQSISNADYTNELLDNKTHIQFPDSKSNINDFDHLIKISSSFDSGEKFILLADPQRRFSKILQLGRVGESGESYAFNRDGVMISESRFTKDLIQNGLLKTGELSELNITLRDPKSNNFTSMATNAIKGYEGKNVSGYNDYRGIKVIGAWTWSEKLGIGIATEIDFDEAYKSYLKVERMSWYTGILFIVLISILTGMFIMDRVKLAKMKEQIQQSELQFRSIATTAKDAIVSANAYGIIKSWNKAAEDIFGYTSEESIGQDMAIIIPDKYKDAHRKGMERVRTGGDKHAIGKTVELQGQHKNGSQFPIELSLSNWESADGMEFSGIIRDITERKQFEEALKKANERMSGELNVAKDIQMSMLPLIFPAFPKRKDINIFADLIPAREVGGDFYDFFFIDESHLCFIVGDVSGKGVPAALMMAVCKTLLKSKASKDMSTASIMTQVNSEMAAENNNYMFVTVFMGILNTKTGDVVYTNAGHNPSYIKRCDGSFERLTELHGPVVAAMEGIPYKESHAKLGSGEFVFAYTDGIPEAHNVNDELYGNDRLDEFILNNEFDTPQTVVEDIISSVHKFEGEAEKFDDVTVLCVEYLGKSVYDVTHNE